VIEPKGLSGVKLDRKIGAKLLAHRGCGHRVNQRFALSQGVMAEPRGVENLLACQETLGIASEALDEGVARGQRIEASPQTGEAGAGLGPTGRRALAQLLGPGAPAVHMHKAGLGAHGGRCQTRQEGVLERARDPPAGRQKMRESGGVLVRALAHAGGRVGDIVDAGACQPSFLQPVDGFLQRAATVFEVDRRSAHVGDETPEDPGNGCTRPRLGDRDPNAVDVLQRGGTMAQLMVRGIDGHNGSSLACPQAHAAIDHPDEAVGEGGSHKGHAPQPTSALATPNRESDDPVEDGWWTRCPLDAEC